MMRSIFIALNYDKLTARLSHFGIHGETFSFHSEYAQLFATLIARTAKDVDVLIDSLPSEESTSALQVKRGGVASNH